MSDHIHASSSRRGIAQAVLGVMIVMGFVLLIVFGVIDPTPPSVPHY